MAVKQETRLNVSLRSVWVRALVATALLAGFAWAWWTVFLYFRDTLDLAFIAYPVGVGVAILGYLAVGLAFRRFGPKARPLHQSGGNLSVHVKRRISAFDPLTHRVHPLGDPWPQAVVSTSGIQIVEPLAVSGTFTELDGEVQVGSTPLGHPSYGEVRRLVATVRDVMEAKGVDLHVSGLMVVDDAAVVPQMLQAGDRDVRFVHVDQLPDAVSFAPTARVTDVDLGYEALQRWRPHHGRR